MKPFKMELQKFENTRLDLAQAEKLFDLPITMYPEFLYIQKEMKGLEQVYALYEEQNVIDTRRMYRNSSQFLPQVSPFTCDSCPIWVLHIAKFGYFFSPSLLNMEWLILEPLPFFFYQKFFIFRLLENCL